MSMDHLYYNLIIKEKSYKSSSQERDFLKYLKYRVPNRGFEGLTIDEEGNVYATVQSTLDVEGKTKDVANFTRVIKLNPETKEVETFAYPLDNGYKKIQQLK